MRVVGMIAECPALFGNSFGLLAWQAKARMNALWNPSRWLHLRPALNNSRWYDLVEQSLDMIDHLP